MKGFPGGSVVKNLPANAGDVGSVPGQKDLLEKKWQTTPVFLPGKSQVQRSLVGYSSWDCKESDMTERLSFIQSYSICFSLAYFTLC